MSSQDASSENSLPKNIASKNTATKNTTPKSTSPKGSPPINEHPFSRYIKIGDWFFEIKTVRALKVDEYGLPYDAIANCNINGDSMYIDGLLTKNDKEFTREDFATFHKFGHQIGVDRLSYHRYQNGESVTKDLDVDLSLAESEKQETKSEHSFEQVMRIVK